MPVSSTPTASRHYVITLRSVFLLLVLAGCGLLLINISAPAAVARLAERYLSSDGNLTTRGREGLSQLLYLTALSCICWGLAALAWSLDALRGKLRSFILYDPLGPSPQRVLAASTLLGAAILLLYWADRRLGVPLGWLFDKEALLEHMTALLYGVASGVMAIAAYRLPIRSRRGDSRRTGSLHALSGLSRAGLSFGFWVLALLFFFVAMEEISWGQRIFGYGTPAGYEQINVQREANVHNLLSQAQLDYYTRLAAFVVFATLLAGWTLLAITAKPFLQLLMPHPSLLPLAYLTYVIAPHSHLEVLELMSGIFAAFYVWRVLGAVCGTDLAAARGN